MKRGAAFVMLLALLLSCAPLRARAVSEPTARYVAEGSFIDGVYTLQLYLSGANAAGGSVSLKYDPTILSSLQFTPQVTVVEPTGYEIQNDTVAGYHTFLFVANDGSSTSTNQPAGIDGAVSRIPIATYTFAITAEDYRTKFSLVSIGIQNWSDTPQGQEKPGDLVVGEIQGQLWKNGFCQGFRFDSGEQFDIGWSFSDAGVTLPYVSYVLEGMEQGDSYTLKVFLEGMCSAGGTFSLDYDQTKLTLAEFKPNVVLFEGTGFPVQSDPDAGYHTFYYLANDGGANVLNRPGGLDGTVEGGYLLGAYTFTVLTAGIDGEKDFGIQDLMATSVADSPAIKEIWDVDASVLSKGYPTSYFMGEDRVTRVGMRFGAGEAEPGVNVTLKVTSYDPQKQVTATLTNQADGTKIYVGRSAAVDTGSGLDVDRLVTIQNVPAGTYSLTVAKESHLTLTKQTVNVAGADGTTMKIVGLTTGAPDDTGETARLIPGDVADQSGAAVGDGHIGQIDRALLTRPAYYGKAADTAERKHLDLNGDGVINQLDLMLLIDPAHYGKCKSVIP